MELVLTSDACPEQYSLLDDDGAEVGFFRLRHGRFRVEDGCGWLLHDTCDLVSDGVFVDDEREECMVPAIDLVLDVYGLGRHGLATELLERARSTLVSQLDD